MPSRVVCLALLLYWVVAAASLIRRDVLPEMGFVRPLDRAMGDRAHRAAICGWQSPQAASVATSSNMRTPYQIIFMPNWISRGELPCDVIFPKAAEDMSPVGAPKTTRLNGFDISTRN